jgi:hypothetical protein
MVIGRAEFDDAYGDDEELMLHMPSSGWGTFLTRDCKLR